MQINTELISKQQIRLKVNLKLQLATDDGLKSMAIFQRSLQEPMKMLLLNIWDALIMVYEKNAINK